MLRGILIAVWVALIGGCLSACTPISDSPPHQTAFDRDRSSAQRIAAIERMSAAQIDQLFEFIQSSRHPIAVREAAMDRLIEQDPAAFWRRVDLHLVAIDDWPMVRLLCDRAVADRTEGFVPIAIKSWARPSIRVADEDRPERAAIHRLSPGQSPEALLEQLLIHWEKTDSANDIEQLLEAAWIILARQLQDPALRSIIAKGSPDHPVLDPLGIAAPSLDHLPADVESMRRLASLLKSSTPQQWQQRAAFRSRAQREDQVSGVELRHFPAIDHLDSYETFTRQELLEILRSLMAGRVHHYRGDRSSNQYIEQRQERLADYESSLSRGDLLVLLKIHTSLIFNTNLHSLFSQAEADRADTTTEHGGVLTWSRPDKELAFKPYAPMMRRHDRIYIASDDCVAAMHTGLAHYHFHAESHDSGQWAGPGRGDLRFAQKMQANCIVFTFIDPDTLNVDVYFPSGAIIDLGEIKSVGLHPNRNNP